MKTTSLLTTLALTGALTAALAGCTSGGDASPSPSPTDTPAAAADAGQPDDVCTDGIAFITFTDGEGMTKALPNGCDTIVVNGDGGTLTAGPAKVVFVTGSDNTIDVDALAQADLDGDRNAVTHGGGGEPVLNTDGTDNTVTAR